MPVQLDHPYPIQPYKDSSGSVEPPRKSALLRLSPDALAAIAGGGKVHVEYDGNGVPVLNVEGQRYPLKSLPEPAHHELHVRVCVQGPKAKSAPFLQYGTIKSKLKVDPTLPIASSNLTPEEAAIAGVKAKTHREREERDKGRIVRLDEPPLAPSPAPAGKRRPGSGTKRPPVGTNDSANPSRVASPAPIASTAAPSAPIKTDRTLEGRLFRLLAQKGASKENDIIKRLTGSPHPDAGVRKGILAKLNEMASKSGKSGTSKTPDLWELKRSTWLSARPWDMEGVQDTERERLARLVTNKLEELGVPPTDPVWKALRPPTPPSPPPIRAARSPVPPAAAEPSLSTTTTHSAKPAKTKPNDRDAAPSDRPVKKIARANPNLPARPSPETVARGASEQKIKRDAEKPLVARDEGARALKDREPANSGANAVRVKAKAERKPSPSIDSSSKHRTGDYGLTSSASQDVKKTKSANPTRDPANPASSSKAGTSLNPSKRPREGDAHDSFLKVSSSRAGALNRERDAISPQPGTSPRPQSRPTHTRAPPSTSSLADIVPDPKYLPNEAIKGKIPRHVKDEEEEGEIEEPSSSKRRRVEDAEKAREERERESRALKRDRRDLEDRDRDRQRDRGRDREHDPERERDKGRDRWDRERESSSRYSSDSRCRGRDVSPEDARSAHQPPLSHAEIKKSVDAIIQRKEGTIKKRSESPPSKMDQLQQASKKVKRESSPAVIRTVQSKVKEKAHAKAESVDLPMRTKERKRLLRDLSPKAESTASSRASTKPPKRRSPHFTSSSEDEDDNRGRSPPKSRKFGDGSSAASSANKVHAKSGAESPTYQELRMKLHSLGRRRETVRLRLAHERDKLQDLLEQMQEMGDADSGISVSTEEEWLEDDDIETLKAEFDALTAQMAAIRLQAEAMIE